MQRPTFHKYTTEELLETIAVFNLAPETMAAVQKAIEQSKTVPDAGNFFRYYNPHSRTERFEKEYAAHVGAKYALAVNSGTSALIA